MIDFEIVGEIVDIESIAAGTGIRDRARLKKQYGKGRWRKLKGTAYVKLVSGRIRLSEIHWYKAHGVARRNSS